MNERKSYTAESNSLHELAERLRPFSMHSGAKFYPTASDREDIGKAVRIIEELAKVSDGHWEVICDGPDAYLCTAGDLKVQCAIGRCRAIAEEVT